MIRNLDLTALRSLVMVVDTGGVTRAAQQLNLTQSAVSMQLKRLEEALNQPLIDRSGRSLGLTPQGEQMVSYARRLLALNDEALARVTSKDYAG
ncbi:MAG: LysR family transcriptional regulator, partial [Pseudomonadota bacterium]